MGVEFNAPPSCPQVIRGGQLQSAYTGGRPATLASAEGHWASCDVFLKIDAQWLVAGYTVELYAIAEGVRTRLRKWTLNNVQGVTGTNIYLGNIVHYCSGFEMVINSGALAAPVTERTPCQGVLCVHSYQHADPTVVLRYDAVPPTLTDGTTWPVNSDSSGALRVTEANPPGYEDNTEDVATIIERPLATSTYVQTRFVNFGTVTAAVVKAAAGNVKKAIASHSGAAGVYFQLHNKASIPLAGEAPIGSFWVPPLTTLQFDMPNAGFHHTTGIGFAWSTTAATFTDATVAAEHTTTLLYT